MVSSRSRVWTRCVSHGASSNSRRHSSWPSSTGGSPTRTAPGRAAPRSGAPAGAGAVADPVRPEPLQRRRRAHRRLLGRRQERPVPPRHSAAGTRRAAPAVPACVHCRPDTALGLLNSARAAPTGRGVTQPCSPCSWWPTWKASRHDLVLARADADDGRGQPRPARRMGRRAEMGTASAPSSPCTRAAGCCCARGREPA